MFVTWWRRLFVVTAVVACATAAQSADRLEQFRQARREMLPLLRSKQPSDRIEGLHKLSEFPLEDAVKLMYAALDDPVPEVQRAAFVALKDLNGNFEVCESLLQLLRRDMKSKNGPAAVAAPLSILLASDLQSTQRDLDGLLSKATSSKAGATLAVALIDEFARRQSAADVVPLGRLAEMQVFDDHFGVRRTWVHALTMIRTKEAVGVLIDNLDRVGGESRADAVEHLTQVTGQIFGTESAAWQRWWEGEKDQFEMPPSSYRVAYRSTLTESASGYYYGMPIFAERAVFVLDTSGSMSGQRIVAAKRELTKAITGLADYVHFGIIVFNSRVSVWQHELVPATEQHKRAAIRMINNQQTTSSTASYNALEAAFAFDTEAIYFLSDGAPNVGKIVAPVDIVTAVAAQNQVRRISVYTIGISPGFPGSPLDVFLKTLAERNLGVYRRVDN